MCRVALHVTQVSNTDLAIMNSRRSLSFIDQLLFLILFWFVQLGNSRDVSGSRLVQLDDCTCLGYTQTLECTVFGRGTTMWQGTAFDCTKVPNEILLRHSQFPLQAMEECNDGAITAMSIGVSDMCYTSRLIVTIGEEMINETVKCFHDDFNDTIRIIGQKSLTATEVPYPPPSNVYIESNDSHQITFAWDEVTMQCLSLQYIITAINCGVCPNTTTDKNVTCHIQSDISLRTNHTCLFAVQTEICGYLRGKTSDYITVYIGGKENLEDELITMPQAGSELVNNVSRAIVIPLIASVMSIGVFLLLLIVVVLIIFMSKQIAKNNAKSRVNTIPQDDVMANNGTAAQNNQEGIYSLLQPPEDNDMLNSVDQKEIVVYADMGPNPGEGLHCESTLQFQDDKVEYAEIKSLNHEPAFNSSDSSIPLDLNNVLHQIGMEVSQKWYQLGIAVGINEEMLDECLNHSPKEAVVEVLDYWIRKHKPSWEDVAEVLNEVGLHELANSLLDQRKLTRQTEDEDRIEDLLTASTSPAYDDSS